MRKIVLILFFIAFGLVGTSAYAQYSSRAYGGTKDDTIFTRTSDWFATVGKSQEEKFIIQKERRAIRKKRKALRAIAQKKKDFAKKRAAYRK